MKNIIKLLLFIISVVLFSCKKYEEGPLISFRSKKSKMTGVWKSTVAFIYDANGAVDLDSSSAQWSRDMATRKFDFSPSYEYKEWDWGNNLIIDNVQWSFNSEYTRVVLDYRASGEDRPIESWRIKKFYNDAVWLTISVDSIKNANAIAEIHLAKL